MKTNYKVAMRMVCEMRALHEGCNNLTTERMGTPQQRMLCHTQTTFRLGLVPAPDPLITKEVPQCGTAHDAYT